MLTIVLKGYTAIEYARRKALCLNHAADATRESLSELTVAEAEALASSHPEAIWLETNIRDFAHFLLDDALDELRDLGDSERIVLWPSPSGDPFGGWFIEIVSLTHQEYVIRLHADAQPVGPWEIVSGRESVMQAAVGMLSDCTSATATG